LLGEKGKNGIVQGQMLNDPSIKELGRGHREKIPNRKYSLYQYKQQIEVPIIVYKIQ